VTHALYRTPQWRKASRDTLKRDGYFCMIRLPGCKGRAVTADHIIDHDDGGEWFALENLQAACRSCNTAKRNMRVAARARAQRAGKPTNRRQEW